MRFSDFFFGQIPRRQPGSLTILLQLPDMTRQYTTFGDGDNNIFFLDLRLERENLDICVNFGHKY